MKPSTYLLLSLFAIGCGASPGTQPHDMSAAGHEAVAEREEAAADEHRDQYDPADGVRWSDPTSTATHSRDIARHRTLAAKHREASEALRRAEAEKCAGIAEADRDTSPFFHAADIVAVSPIEEEAEVGEETAKQMRGVRIEFVAVPGLTTEWLQRLVDCHLARAAALGHEVPEMSYCPLVPKDVNATVSSAGNGFAIDVTSENAETVQEIVRRARALREPREAASSVE